MIVAAVLISEQMIVEAEMSLSITMPKSDAANRAKFFLIPNAIDDGTGIEPLATFAGSGKLQQRTAVTLL